MPGKIFPFDKALAARLLRTLQPRLPSQTSASRSEGTVRSRAEIWESIVRRNAASKGKTVVQKMFETQLESDADQALVHQDSFNFNRLIVVLPVFVFSVLAFAQVGNGGSCHWAFPKWFGCVLTTHESLAAGLIGTAGALIAAWYAWSAVQQQINAERERAIADRVEVERLLSNDLTDYADGIAAAWRLLDELPHDADAKQVQQVYEATAYMAERLSRPEPIASYRSMIEVLGWDQRRKYSSLIRGLEELAQFNQAELVTDKDEVLGVIRRLSYDFESCLPSTSDYFDGLWRRVPKAMSFADWVRRVGGDPEYGG
jgi:hypothetical protein